MRLSGRHQQGIALLTVVVVLALCALTVVSTTRSGLLHEMLTGHQSDQLRAQATAEALVRDAEIDITGTLPDGRMCREAAQGMGQPLAGFVGCRQRGEDALPTAPYFPQSIEEFEEVQALLQVGASIPCRDGICFPSSLQALEQLEDRADTMQTLGARYGQFTRAESADAGAAGNPLLAAEPARAWYWVEAFRYDIGPDSLTQRRHLQPDPTRPFVYRITVVAHGLKPGTRAVIKSLFVPYPSAQLP